jgi:putative membrane protein
MTRQFSAIAAGALAMAFAAAPLAVLHSQVVAPGTNPGTTTPTTGTPQQTTPAAQPSVTADIRNDLPFMQEAASANLMEIQLGQLAQAKASNAAVKQFAQRMVNDHRALEQQVTSTASQNKIALNATINAQHQAQVSRLQSLSGSQFDQSYMSLMIQDHQTDVTKFQQESSSANSAQVRDLAAKSLPVLQQHLTLAQQVGSQVNAQVASTNTTTTTTTGATANANNTNKTGKGNKDIMADSRFIRENATDNYLEVTLARLAERKAQNSAVKDFAQRAEQDHNQAQDEWVRLGSGNGLNVSPGMGKLHRQKLSQLEKVSGKEFDRAYMTMEIQNHKDYIDYLQREGRATHSAQVRQLVNNEIPQLKQHFEQAKQIGAQVGAKTNVTLRGEKGNK